MRTSAQRDWPSTNKASNCLVAAAILIALLELIWFGSKCLPNIDYDGMAYIGIARHLRQGDFYSAINAFRSPLLSWIIAVIPGRNFVLTGKLINTTAFAATGALLYLFTCRLWNSRLTASLAVLLFALGRGFVPVTVGSIVPDFLLAALTLGYFILLMGCLRGAGLRSWFGLGIIHGLAFLAKGFALPWLALATAVAALLSAGTLKQRLARLATAALIPIIAAGAWALVLHSKYGVFTTGTQFKVNLLQWTLHAFRDRPDPTYAVLRDTTQEEDQYFVDDPMPPGSWPWSYHVSAAQVLPKLLQAEKRNVPRAIKEVLILLTPGGLLAFVAATAIVMRRRQQFPWEWRLIAVVGVSAISSLLAYCMLVFESRYLYPLVPLMMAVAARFLIPDEGWNHNIWRAIAIALAVLGEIAALGYSASPLRMITRDYQVGCYNAAHQLEVRDAKNIVSLGAGPFPEHGVGWEAGYKTAFFADRRLIAAADDLPPSDKTAAVLRDLGKASPDAIIVWGNAKDAQYVGLVRTLAAAYPTAVAENISDPRLVTVGTILFPQAKASPGN